jgi:hypothetical protein
VKIVSKGSMIQLLSLKFQKQVCSLMLSTFLANTLFAGREYLFLESDRIIAAKGDSYHSFPRQLMLQDRDIVSTAPQIVPGNFVDALHDKQPVQNLLSSNSPDELNKLDIGGPGQPEMTTFKAVGADNMVDLFSGNFSYNIPLGDVGGYPLNIFYSSGVTMDQEASWVGLGWNINPGSIVRNKRGIPDDFSKGDNITKEMSIKPQVTVGVSTAGGVELTGLPKKVNVGFSGGVFYNNYRGIGFELGINPSLLIWSKNADANSAANTLALGGENNGGFLAGGANFNINSQSGIDVNPSLSLKFFEDKKGISYGFSTSASFNSRIGLQSFGISGEISKSKLFCDGSNENRVDVANGKLLAFSSSLSFGTPSITPSIQMPLTHRNYNMGVSFGLEIKPTIFKNTTLSGYYSEARISEQDQVQTKPAYGYLYLQEANGNADAMLDFNRINDAAYTKNNPVIAIPNYTYDVFSVNGQGTGGGFRAYRGDVGSVHDNHTRTRESSAALNAEIGKGDAIEIGLNLNYVNTPTTAGEWINGNIAREELKFGRSKELHQAVYFKNPAEAAKVDPDFLEKLGDDNLVRIKLLDPAGTRRPMAVPVLEKFSDGQTKVGEISIKGGQTIKTHRDKRSQIITYLTAGEADYLALDKFIQYYPVNDFPNGSCDINQVIKKPRLDGIRKQNHLSEITVTQTDGKRYVYGIPVYNLREEEVSFNINSNAIKDIQQRVSYDNGDLKNNKNGKDWFYQNDKLDPYAHSFLLTGLLSADYVDVTGNGISDDDLGTSVKFNYTKLEHKDEATKHGFAWRAPLNNDDKTWAAYSEGLKTDNSDDKGHFTYGEREIWYMNSIESKSLIATFTLEDRLDGKAAKNDYDNNGTGLSEVGMKRLKRIDIYSKADWIKPASNRKPIKSIHFDYSYELCANAPDNNNTTETGKLTLKSIYFTYNGNVKQIKNKYVFNYHSNNPSYNRANSDRWGTYKRTNANISGIPSQNFIHSNSEFPFSDQDKTSADQDAAAWTLSEVTLPSGAKIKVDYESDDYAYVQNRRAAQMFRIAGFGKSPGSTPQNSLYAKELATEKFIDNFYIFVDVPVPVATKADVKAKYLDGVHQLFMKLWVKMPTDQYGSGYEPIPTYAIISEDNQDNYGRVNDTRIWVKVKPDNGGYSPMFYNSMQFMTKNLASKAYPGSDVKGDPLGAFRAIAGMLFSVSSFVKGFYENGRQNGWCKNISLQDSYIRLNNPTLKKLGGGIRVKRVTVKDSWKEMTSSKESLKAGNPDGMPDAEYGQEYDYTTSAWIGGQEIAISSGVASYEPIVGAEENPFREVMHYDDRQPLGPNQRGAIEMPLGEVFYPSPSIGYSKVTVRSIHRDNVKSGVGKTVTEFYTTKEFPTKSDFISFDDESNVRYKSNDILRILKVDVRRVSTLSQGFRLQTNDMNGKVHQVITYDEAGKQISFTENIYRTIQTGEQKYAFNNVVSMMDRPGDPIRQELMGKEIELMTDFREHLSKAVTFNMNFNVNTNMWGPIPVPVPSIIPPVTYAESGYRSASVLKIINTFGILEQVRHIEKGSQVTTRDMIYDVETGNVLVTETNNEFNKPLYSVNYPAHWAYKGMGGAYNNIDAVYENVVFQNGKLTTPDFDMSVFESGDELFVKDYSENGAYDEPGCYASGPIQFIPKSADENGKYVRKIWALDMRKDGNNTEAKFIFIDKNGQPYSGGNVSFRIVRSGKRNHLDASVGGFTSLSNPIRETANGSGIYKLFADDNTNILKTGANTFKENWRVDNQFYIKDGTTVTVRQATIQQGVLAPTQIMAAALAQDADHDGIYGNDEVDFEISPNSKVNFNKHRWMTTSKHRRYVDENVWLKFDPSSLLAGSTVLSAKINLYGDRNVHRNGRPITNSYFNDHNQNVPHFNGHDEGNSSHNAAHNLFKISRMNTPWYGNSDVSGWRSIFNVSSSNLSIAGLTPPLPVGSFTKDFNVDVKSVMQGMIDNINNPNQAPGIKLSFLTNSYDITAHKWYKDYKPKWHYCFEPFAYGNNPGVSIEFSYYKCLSSDPIVYAGDISGAPTSAPPGFVFCNTYESNSGCLSHFDNQRINPYIKGVLGNWRADVNYVYYDNRRESSASAETAELSKGGVIAAGYKSFWISSTSSEHAIEMNTAYIKRPEYQKDSHEPANPTNANVPWTWNVKPTQFNSKGFELENTDPLGRFNSGIYGYDQTLPIAVSNNAKLRNTAFDGFEDYEYSADNCLTPCKAQKHLFIENAGAHLSTNVRHSGQYSLKVNAGQSVSVKADVVTKAADENGYGLEITNTITQSTGTWVNPSGTGLVGHYFNIQNVGGAFAFNPFVTSAALNLLENNVGYVEQIDPSIKMQSNPRNENEYLPGIKPPEGIGQRSGVKNSDYFCVRWEGLVQAPEKGIYTFKFSSDDGMKVWIDGQEVTSTNFFSVHGLQTESYTTPEWTVGSTHSIKIYYFEKTEKVTAKLSWKRPSGMEEIVPMEYLYKNAAAAQNTVVSGTIECIKPNRIQVKDNALTNFFSPVQGQKMVFSAWVKEDVTDCHCNNFPNNQVDVYYNNSSTATTTIHATGQIIDGWQRYEGAFDIPSSATKLEIKLKSTSAKDVYWDDLRIHPFNANMKSFVYHPSNLRLMAELDENNYATFYEYNDDGTLTRVKKETIQGIKTITETRSAIQKRINQIID